MLTETVDISLSQGLQGQDEHIVDLLKLWNELQSSSVDAAQAPMSDLFSFAETALFLAIIMQKPKPDAKGNRGPTKSAKRVHAHAYAATPFTSKMYERMYRNEFLPESSNTRELLEPYDAEQFPVGHDDAVWDTKEWETSDVMNRRPASLPLQKQSAIGLLYLTSTPHITAPAGDINIGVVLDAASRGRGYARQAVELVLPWVFEEMKFHRVQAAILDSPEKPKAMSFYMQMGFGHEGTRRRSVFSPAEGMWKDATYLGMLDTEWLMRPYFRPAPKSLWDEMFLRHNREREELLRWDEKRSGLQRTSSMETLRNTAITPDPEPSEPSRSSSMVKLEPVYADDAASDVAPLLNKGKRKHGEIPEPWDDRAESPPPSSESSYGSSSLEESDHDIGSPEPLRIRRTSALGDVASGRKFTIDPFQNTPENHIRSSSPEGSIGSVDSRWDMFETSSTSSSSNFETSSTSSNFESLRDSDME